MPDPDRPLERRYLVVCEGCGVSFWRLDVRRPYEAETCEDCQAISDEMADLWNDVYAP